MVSRRARRFVSPQSLLPIRVGHTSNSFSCWYCDWKIRSFNELLFSIGHQYSRFLRVWFAVGAAVSFVAFVIIAMLLMWESAAALHLLSGTSGITSLIASLLFDTSPLAFVSNMSILNAGITVFSTLISVAIHEFGHAVAATSEGVQIEYIAIFLAIIFPGALVALNYDLLQGLPRSAALRIYCAGIWHNVMLCAVCGLTLSLLPLILNPLYMHGEIPMVMGVPKGSPLANYLSPRDVIKSVDGLNISHPHDWTKKIVQINAQSLHKSVMGRKGYCVPSSWTTNTQAAYDPFSCPDELAAFARLFCLNSSLVEAENGSSNENRRKQKHCLIAKDVVKLKKCGDGWQVSGTGSKSCVCLEEEFCMTPVQTPGMSWVEISYASPYSSECLQFRKNISADTEDPDYGSSPCGGTFVFVGNALTLAYSVQLTEYQPRWAFLSANIPTMLENVFSCTFHVSAALAFLNNLPVFLLDGQSILETGLLYITRLNPRSRRQVLQRCLIGGSILSIIALLRTLHFIFRSLML